MLMTGSDPIDAERAFKQMARSRRRAALARRLRREPSRHTASSPSTASPSCAARGRLLGRAGRAEIPLEAIRGTLEPSRATLFDCAFRPAAGASRRWQRLWIAEHRGVTLPPISVVRVGNAYAIRDGHHRVSVARARGAVTIDATVDATAP